MRLINLVLIYMASTYAGLPELSTKQSLNNIRFISQDNKITYYQMRSGSLSLTSNYQNKVILKNKMNTNYLIHSSFHRKKMIIEVDENFHQNYHFLKKKKLYQLKYGGSEALFVAEGSHPKLQLNDTYVSFYHPIESEIHLMNLENKEAKTIVIPLNHPINPFFVPDVVMLDPENILFTNMNKQGMFAVFKYNILDKQYINLITSKFNGLKIEICKSQNKIIVGQFSYPTLNRGSSISKIEIDATGSLVNQEEIYQSSLHDPGNILCTDSDEIFFVKKIKNKNYLNTEVASINLSNKKLSILSDLKKVTQIISMDGRILIPYREKFFVLSGSSNLKNDSFQKEKKP